MTALRPTFWRLHSELTRPRPHDVGPTVLKLRPANRVRAVHAKGTGAHGFFEVTEDVTPWTSAAFLSRVGKRTPMFARFSTVAGEPGSADTVRDPRGFALKFYTEAGNYDLIGSSTPVFCIRDASRFSDFIHSQRRLPDSGIRSNDRQWDFWTRTPASAHQVAIVMSDRGIPRTLRHMHGYGGHTYSWMNAGGERFWVKYHFKSAQGIENLTRAEAVAMAGEDPDFHRRDLWDTIGSGEAAEWRLEIQVMPFEAAADYRLDPFDVTKVWPHADHPPIPVGRMVLDRNPADHVAEVEQAAFSPASLVPGIGLSPDKLLMGRISAYHDAHRHRIGADYEQLPINAPRCGGPRADPSKAPPSWRVEAGEKHIDDFIQAGTLYRDVMHPVDRAHLVTNIVAHAGAGVSAAVQSRVIDYWRSVDAELGARVAAGLGHPESVEAA
jgi:catalase